MSAADFILQIITVSIYIYIHTIHLHHFAMCAYMYIINLYYKETFFPNLLWGGGITAAICWAAHTWMPTGHVPPRKCYEQEIRCGPEPDVMPALENTGGTWWSSEMWCNMVQSHWPKTQVKKAFYWRNVHNNDGIWWTYGGNMKYFGIHVIISLRCLRCL